MGWGLGRMLTAAGTLGASEVANYATGGSIYGGKPKVTDIVSGATGAAGLGAQAAKTFYDGSRPQSTQGGQAQYNNYSPINAQDKIKSIYGSSADNISGDVESYMGTLRNNRTKNVADADIYNQQAGRERGIAKTKAGLSGVDTSAQDEQARRNSIYGAAALNETAQRTANAEFGKGVGNVIGGVNRIEQQAEATRLASLPVPVAKENSGGLFDSVFGWLA
jgi:hypothetical protein